MKYFVLALVAAAGLTNLWLGTKGLMNSTWEPLDITNIIAFIVMAYLFYSMGKNR